MKYKFLCGIFVILFLINASACSRSEMVINGINQYINAWKKSDYKLMYSKIDEESKSIIGEKEFINRYDNIYSGMGVKDINVNIDTGKDIKYEDGNAKIPIKVNMDTVAGKLNFTNTITLTKETSGGKTNWNVVWGPESIFPQLSDGDKVRVDTVLGKRGTIKDRNGSVIAEDGYVAQVGIVPGDLGESGEISKENVASLLNVSKDDIDKKLSASYVKPYMFVPIKVIPEDDERLSVLEKIPGVSINNKKARVYPLKAAAAHLSGYVQEVTAEDLKSNKNYNPGDVIGKIGVEKIYDSILRAENGYEIYIVDKSNNKKKVLAKREVHNGKDIKLTIDSKIQSLLYDQLKEDAGMAVSMNPKTGEVLALVSTPAFDPNDFVMGMSPDVWNSLNEDKKRPFYNRFQSNIVPGSVFKPVTAAIGLKSNKLNPQVSKNISGLKWQKDSSWGAYYVTRVKDYGQPSNLLNAFIYSDNIYFAETALDIGKDTMKTELENFGLGEQMPFEYGLSKSQLSADGDIKNDLQLADSGYGQGQILLNPVHLMAIYDSFVNNGNIIKPYLLCKDNTKAEIWKKNVYSKEVANTILSDLIQVVSNPNGTGHGAYIPGMTLAGKTGTAEIKNSQQDTKGTEVGWFAAVNVDNPDLLVVAMVENAKDKGGSHYVVPMVKEVFKQMK
ncbi:penicillin-binding transpeptidase domain-containing protein [Clostridium sp. WILCCON 0269]|uniref:Penicillin-binding transpeptidase domain-containing protein n=1 Tax=Candidatus Clostridium eludens TaxID=3381663 RepID=A0ABW8SGM2_9CLOT